MAKFKVGDVVQLKSGGPKMTCTNIDQPLGTGREHVECKWFAGGKKQASYFPSEALMFPEKPLHEVVEAIERERKRKRQSRRAEGDQRGGTRQ